VATAQLFYYPPVSPQPLWAIRSSCVSRSPSLAIAAGLALTSFAARRRWLLSVVGLALILGFWPRLAFKYRQPAYQTRWPTSGARGADSARRRDRSDPAFFANPSWHIALWILRDAPAFS